MKRVLTAFAVFFLFPGTVAAQSDGAGLTAESEDLLRRGKIVLEHYWGANFEAMKWKQDLRLTDAWEAASRAGEFRDYKAFDEAVRYARTQSTDGFAQKYVELRRAVEAAYRERLATLMAG